MAQAIINIPRTAGAETAPTMMSVVVSITGSGDGVSSVDRNTIYRGNKIWGRLVKCATYILGPRQINVKGTKACSHVMIRKGTPLKTSVFEDITNNLFSCNYPTHLAIAVTIPLFSYKCHPPFGHKYPTKYPLLCYPAYLAANTPLNSATHKVRLNL